MREWIRRRPWIWVIALFVFFVGLSLVFAAVAILNPPIRTQ